MVKIYNSNQLISDIKRLTTAILFVGLIAFLSNRFIKIKIFDEESYVSTIALIALVFLSITLTVLYFIFFLDRENRNYRVIVKYLSINNFNYLLLSGLTLGLYSLSLRGTPFVGGGLSGDLGVHIDKALKIQQTGEIDFDYPPLWMILLNIASNFSGETIIESLKLVDYLLSIITTAGLFLIYNKILPKHLAGTFLIIIESIRFGQVYLESFSIPMFVYSSSVLNIAVLSLIIYRLLEKGSANSLKEILLGAVVGINFLLYYGSLYWMILGIVFFILYTGFSRSKFLEFQRILEIIIGFSFICIGFISNFLNIPISYGILILIFCTFLTYFIKKTPVVIRYNLNRFISVIAALVILSCLFISIGDDHESPFKYSEIFSWASKTNVILSFFTLFVIVALLSVFKVNKVLLNLVICQSILLVSTIFTGLIKANQMQHTGLVELWWRYQVIAHYLLNIITIFLFILLLDRIIVSVRRNGKQISILFMVIFLIFSISSAAPKWQELLPRKQIDSPSLYAHLNCSNLQQVITNRVLRAAIDACKSISNSENYFSNGFYEEENYADKRFRWVYQNSVSLALFGKANPSFLKAPCQDAVRINIYVDSKFREAVELNSNTKYKFLSNVSGNELISLESDAKPCAIAGDKREMLFAVYYD